VKSFVSSIQPSFTSMDARGIRLRRLYVLLKIWVRAPAGVSLNLIESFKYIASIIDSIVASCIVRNMSKERPKATK